METYNSDPKPGRLILPLVLIGMIATTYTFVNRVVENNNLEIIEETVVEETVVEETSTTTTTTIPEDVVQYLEEITGEKIQAIELGKKTLLTRSFLATSKTLSIIFMFNSQVLEGYLSPVAESMAAR